MKKKTIEEKVSGAFDKATPDVLDKIKTEVSTAEQTGAPVFTRQRKRPSVFKRVALGVMCAALLVCGGLGVYGISMNYVSASQISFDVNPSIGIEVNSKGKVLNVKANNKDAEIVIQGLDFKGSDYNVAVNAVIGSLLRTGYLSEFSNSVLVSVDGKNQKGNEELERKINGEITQMFTELNFDGAVLSQTVSADAEVKKIAEEYGLSLGKANLINMIYNASAKKTADGKPAYTVKSLAGLTVNELNVLAESLGLNAEGITSSGTASKKAYITEERAIEIALAAAGKNRADVDDIEAEFDFEDSVIVYEVSFEDGTCEYEYEINAVNEEIVEYSYELSDEPETTGEELTEDELKAAAFSAAGVDENTVTDYDCEIDDEEVEIEFVSNGYRYELELLSDGTIVSFEKKVYRTEGEKPAEISAEKAKEAAFAAAAQLFEGKNITFDKNAVTEFESEYEEKERISVYEFEFVFSGYEFECTVNAVTGAIITAHIEKD